MKSAALKFRQLAKRFVFISIKVALSFVVFGVVGFLFMDGYSRYDAVTYKDGKQPTHNRYFKIAVVPGVSGRPFDLIPWDEVSKYSGSLFLPNKKDSYRDEGSKVRNKYWVLEENERGQLIETHHHNSDYDSHSVYQISDGRVIPVSFRIMGPGHAIVGFPVGIVGVCLFWLIVRIAREYHDQFRRTRSSGDNRIVRD